MIWLVVVRRFEEFSSGRCWGQS